MRPDEHKKKKSAQYKKQHGITKGESSAHNPTKSLNKKEAETKKNEVSLKGNKQIQSNLTQNQGNENHSKPNYSRRVVESNWEKYVEPEISEDQLGSDYNELLNSTGGIYSHMQLGVEKNWETKQELDDVLTIDFQKLSDTLGRLPFCERLGLNEKEFEPSLLGLLNGENENVEIAPALKTVFRFSNYDFDFSNPKSSSAKPKETENSIELSSGNNSIVKDDTTHSKEAAVLCASSPVKKLEEEQSRSLSLKSLEISDASSSNEDCLKDEKRVDTALTTDKNVDLNSSELESELDALLSEAAGSNNLPHSEGKLKTKIAPKPTDSPYATPGNHGDQEDLEEWLDSII